MSDFSLNSKNYKTYFAWDKFKNLSKDEREGLIRLSVEEIRKDKGLKDVKVEFFSGDPASRGSCTQDMNGKKCIGHIISLNDDVLTDSEDYYSPYKTFNTINHELEHASQYEHASNRHIKNSDSATLEQRLNDQHYFHADGDRLLINGRTYRFDPQTDYQMYRAQACEADARTAGYSAVEGLKVDGQEDIYLDSYLATVKAREIKNNKQMMSRLGMHSREEMAKEELSYISDKKVTTEERQKVLEYARQKDYETAKEVFRFDSRGKATEEEMKEMFDSDNDYSNFYDTEEFKFKKVNESNHEFYSFANYKWDENGDISDEIDIATEQRATSASDPASHKTEDSFEFIEKAEPSDPPYGYDRDINNSDNASFSSNGYIRNGDEDFFRSVEKDGKKIDMSEDRDFFAQREETGSNDGQVEEDKSFFENVEQKSDGTSSKTDEKNDGKAEEKSDGEAHKTGETNEGTTQTEAEVPSTSNGQKL